MEIIETNLKFKSMSNRQTTDRIILHHSASSVASAEDIHRWHLNNDWEGAGYHFLVRKDGKIYRMRPEEKIGAHAYMNNYNSIGICFEGNFEVEEMSDIQVQSGKELVAYLKNKYGINTVQGHRDVNSTSCPGRNFKFNEIANGQSTAENGQNMAESLVKDGQNEGKIASVQSTLNNRYGFNIAVDNIYGNETKTALTKALQIELNKQFNAGLEVDGIFGNLTRNACVVVEIGDEGNITYLIQAMLICKGYELDVDGIFGNITDKKVKEFQNANGLLIDGKVGKMTFEKLFV